MNAKDIVGLPPAIAIVPSGPIDARINAPSSKSITNRAVVVAALADGESVLRAPLIADDTLRMLDAVRSLGAGVEVRDDAWIITGTAGRIVSPNAELHCGLSGTTLRFLAAVATLAPRPVLLTGEPPLLARPIAPLADALVRAGARVKTSPGSRPPIEVHGGLRGGEITVDAQQSSQFLSAVMLVAPYATEDVVVHAQGLESPGYVEITARLMTDFGAEVERIDETTWRITAGVVYRARAYDIEYDASAAGHLMALAVATGGRIAIPNARVSLQPDARITKVLAQLGARATWDDGGVVVQGPETLSPIDVSLGEMPDQLCTVAVLCALAGATSRIRDVAITRGHETDRIAATIAELAKAGIASIEHPDGLSIVGGTAVQRARIATYDDHRIAMAFAALGASAPGIVIENPACTAKTYPRFWSDLRRAGINWVPA